MPLRRLKKIKLGEMPFPTTKDTMIYLIVIHKIIYKFMKTIHEFSNS
jgi:hypothetical protein